MINTIQHIYYKLIKNNILNIALSKLTYRACEINYRHFLIDIEKKNPGNLKRRKISQSKLF